MGLRWDSVSSLDKKFMLLGQTLSKICLNKHWFSTFHAMAHGIRESSTLIRLDFAVNSAKFGGPVVPAGEVTINTIKANTLCMLIF